MFLSYYSSKKHSLPRWHTNRVAPVYLSVFQGWGEGGIRLHSCYIWISSTGLLICIGGHRFWTPYLWYPISDLELFSPISDNSDVRLNFDIGYLAEIRLVRYPIIRIRERCHTHHRNYSDFRQKCTVCGGICGYLQIPKFFKYWISLEMLVRYRK